MIEVEKYNAVDKFALKRERYWLEELTGTLNNKTPSRTLNKYYKSEDRKKKKEKYRENHKGKIQEYRENNKENAK